MELRLCTRGRGRVSRRRLPFSVVALAGLTWLATACAGERREGPAAAAELDDSDHPDGIAETSPLDEEAELPSSVEPPGGGTEPAAPGEEPAELLVPEPGMYRGTYFVPVTDELASYALFEIDEIEIRVRGGELELRYDLPALLLGDAFGLSFRGAAGSASGVQLLGDHGSADCSAVGSVWRCDEMLRDLSPDLNKIEQELAQMSAPEAEARRAVADVFAVDPIGILSFDMTP